MNDNQSISITTKNLVSYSKLITFSVIISFSLWATMLSGFVPIKVVGVELSWLFGSIISVIILLATISLSANSLRKIGAIANNNKNVDDLLFSLTNEPVLFSPFSSGNRFLLVTASVFICITTFLIIAISGNFVGFYFSSILLGMTVVLILNAISFLVFFFYKDSFDTLYLKYDTKCDESDVSRNNWRAKISYVCAQIDETIIWSPWIAMFGAQLVLYVVVYRHFI